MTRCSADDCDRPVHALSLCQAHYMRAWRASRLPTRPADRWPHRRDCPVCLNGGLTVPFTADPDGRVRRRLCLEHPGWSGLFTVAP